MGYVHRISAHAGSFSIRLPGPLRNRDYEDKLREILLDHDAQTIIEALNRMEHCLRFDRSCEVDSERMTVKQPGYHP